MRSLMTGSWSSRSRSGRAGGIWLRRGRSQAAVLQHGDRLDRRVAAPLEGTGRATGVVADFPAAVGLLLGRQPVTVRGYGSGRKHGPRRRVAVRGEIEQVQHLALSTAGHRVRAVLGDVAAE